MITKTKMGVTSVIRDVLKLNPKCVHCSKLNVGEFFEYSNHIFIYVGDGKSIDQDGFKVTFVNEYVRPIRVNIEYDYHLLREDGTEVDYY